MNEFYLELISWEGSYQNMSRYNWTDARLLMVAAELISCSEIPQAFTRVPLVLYQVIVAGFPVSIPACPRTPTNDVADALQTLRTDRITQYQ